MIGIRVSWSGLFGRKRTGLFGLVPLDMGGSFGGLFAHYFLRGCYSMMSMMGRIG